MHMHLCLQNMEPVTAQGHRQLTGCLGVLKHPQYLPIGDE